MTRNFNPTKALRFLRLRAIMRVVTRALTPAKPDGAPAVTRPTTTPHNLAHGSRAPVAVAFCATATVLVIAAVGFAQPQTAELIRVIRTEQSRAASFEAVAGDATTASGRVCVDAAGVLIDIDVAGQQLAGLSEGQARAAAALLLAMADDAGGNSGGVSGSVSPEPGTATGDESGADPPAPPVWAAIAPQAGDTYTIASGATITLNGAMPIDHHALAIAWSKDRQELVDEFAHIIAWSPADPNDLSSYRPQSIDNAKLDALAPGRYQIQLIPRDAQSKPAGPIARYDLTILPPSGDTP